MRDVVAKRLPGVIAKFGGHAFAAGVTLAEHDLPRFKQAFEALARECLSPAHLERILESDGPLADAELSVELATALGREVWGQGFPAPLFDDAFSVIDQRVVGGDHSKLTLARGVGRYDAILFWHADPLPASIHAAYRPEMNEWNGVSSLQLVVEHWRPG